MKRFIYIRFFGFFILSCLGWSCVKESRECNASLVPLVTTNAPVIAGDSLKLSVSGIGNVYMYNWYGPNGFSSHDSSPAIAGVSAVNAGRYSVDVITNDGCIYTGKTDSVSVGAPVLPCSLQDDAAAFNGLSNMYFTYITGSPNGGSYFLEANGAEGDAEVEFFGNALPATGVYSITSDIDLSPGTVHVNFTTLSSLWYPDPGATVYVIVVNKKITVSSCSLHIFSGTWNYGATGSFQLTQQ